MGQGGSTVDPQDVASQSPAQIPHLSSPRRLNSSWLGGLPLETALRVGRPLRGNSAIKTLILGRIPFLLQKKKNAKNEFHMDPQD